MLKIAIAKNQLVTLNRVAALIRRYLRYGEYDSEAKYTLYLYIPKKHIKKGKVMCVDHLPNGEVKDIVQSIEYIVLHSLIHEHLHYVLSRTVSYEACDMFDNIAVSIMDELMIECGL